LIRRLGVSDSEFTSDAGSGAIQLFNAGGFDHVGSAALSPATALWGSEDKLKNYDIVLNACQCSQEGSEKTQPMMDNMKAYADIGGRIFNSHYANVWIGGDSSAPTKAPMVWKDIATWYDNLDALGSSDVIDQVNTPKGMSFATWMTNVGGSTAAGTVAIDPDSFRNTAQTLDRTKAEQWVYWDSGAGMFPQNFQFTTPNEAAQDQRCGKVVFSDMHVGGDQMPAGTFPDACATGPLSPQEKAIAFMFFDIASCVNVVQ
jgi:hypothetical protein